MPVVSIDSREGVDASSISPSEDFFPRARRFGANVTETVHLGVDNLLRFPGKEVLELVAVRPHVGADHHEMVPHPQIAEETQEVPGHTVTSLASTQPDSDIVVVRDIEDEPPVPAAVLRRR